MKKEFVPRKKKVYFLSREEREEVREFIQEQMRKEYIWPLKLLQTTSVFFVGKKDGKKRMVQDYQCYSSRPIEWSLETTLVLEYTRELDRVPKTK